MHFDFRVSNFSASRRIRLTADSFQFPARCYYSASMVASGIEFHKHFLVPQGWDSSAVAGESLRNPAMLVARPGEFHCRVAYIHENGLDQEAIAPGANPATIRLDFDFPDTAR